MTVALLQMGGKAAGVISVRLGAVEQNQIGLANVIQLRDDAPFRLHIILPGQLRHRAVGGDDDAHRGMFPDDPPGAGLGGLLKGHRFVKPGAFHQPGRTVLLAAQRPADQIPHTVHQPGAEAAAAL